MRIFPVIKIIYKNDKGREIQHGESSYTFKSGNKDVWGVYYGRKCTHRMRGWKNPSILVMKNGVTITILTLIHELMHWFVDIFCGNSRKLQEWIDEWF